MTIGSTMRVGMGRAALAIAGMLISLMPAHAEIDLAKAQASGLKIGFANFRPYSFVSDDGSIKGESVDVVKAVLAQMKINAISPVASEFGALIPSLQAQRIDMVASGLTVRPARCKEVAFSAPYLTISEAFVVKKGNPKGLLSYEDLVAKGAKFGMVAGASQLRHAEAAGIPAAQVSQLPDLPTALAALRTGRIDALGLTSLSAAGVVQQVSEGANDLERTPAILKIGDKSVISYNAFAFNKADEKFLAAFNAELQKFMGSAEHLAKIQPYGLTAADLPKNVSLAALCAE